MKQLTVVVERSVQISKCSIIYPKVFIIYSGSDLLIVSNVSVSYRTKLLTESEGVGRGIGSSRREKG